MSNHITTDELINQLDSIIMTHHEDSDKSDKPKLTYVNMANPASHGSYLISPQVSPNDDNRYIFRFENTVSLKYKTSPSDEFSRWHRIFSKDFYGELSENDSQLYDETYAAVSNLVGCDQNAWQFVKKEAIEVLLCYSHFTLNAGLEQAKRNVEQEGKEVAERIESLVNSYKGYKMIVAKNRYISNSLKQAVEAYKSLLGLTDSAWVSELMNDKGKYKLYIKLEFLYLRDQKRYDVKSRIVPAGDLEVTARLGKDDVFKPNFHRDFGDKSIKSALLNQQESEPLFNRVFFLDVKRNAQMFADRAAGVDESKKVFLPF